MIELEEACSESTTPERLAQLCWLLHRPVEARDEGEGESEDESEDDGFDYQLALALAENQKTPSEGLARVARIDEKVSARVPLLVELRASVAAHPNAPSALLEALAFVYRQGRHAEPLVAIAKHPATPAWVLVDLAAIDDERVSIALAKCRRAPPACLEALAARAMPRAVEAFERHGVYDDVIEALLENPATPDDVRALVSSGPWR